MARNDYDFSGLAWVKGEIETTLEQARSALKSYVENPGDITQLRFCTTYLHQVRGTLKILELYGAELLAEEMEQVAQALLDDKVNQREDAYEVLLKAIMHMPSYLERISSGHTDIPIVLLPLLNDLRTSRNQSLLSDNALFSPDLSVPAPAQPVDTEQKRDETSLRKLRQKFQFSLVGWYRNTSQVQMLQNMADVLNGIETYQQDINTQVWWVARGLIEAIKLEGIELSISIKMLMGQVDREIKQLIDKKDNYDPKSAADLTKNMLFYIGHCVKSGPLVDEIKQKFNLEHLLPNENELENARDSLDRPDSQILNTVSQVLQEELLHIKDALDLFVRNPKNASLDVEQMRKNLRQVADTLGMLGQGVLRERIIEQTDHLDSLFDEQGLLDDGSLMKIASALLSIETSLTSLTEQNTPDEHEQASFDGVDQDAEYYQLMPDVIREALHDISQVKGLIIHFAEYGEHNELAKDAPQLLTQVKGGLQILGIHQPIVLLEEINQLLGKRLLDEQNPLNSRDVDLLADTITGIEYYLESLVERRSDRPEILGFARDSLNALQHETTTDESALTEDIASQSSPYIKDDDIEDMQDIFIEEAEEEQQHITEQLALLQANNRDHTALTTLRRSFHTLKGSGRLVGANEIAEFAWSIENMLNKAIAGTIKIGDELLNTLQQSSNILPSLITSLRNKQPHQENIEQLIGRADALAGDKPSSGRKSASPATETSDSSTPSTDAPVAIPTLDETTSTETVDEALTLDETDSADTTAAIPTLDETTPAETVDEALTLAEADSADATATIPTLDEATPTETVDEALTLAEADSVDATATIPTLDETTPAETVDEALTLAEADSADATATIPTLDETTPTETVDEALTLDETDSADTTAAIPTLDETTPTETVDEALTLDETDSADTTAAIPTLDETTPTETVDEALTLDETAPEAPTDTTPTPDETTGSDAIDTEQPASEPEATESDSSDDIDDEIIEIFIEEAQEQLETIEEYLPQWQQSPQDHESLTIIRRAFHTLKGSGRMVAAEEIGEYCWAVEKMLNKLLDNEISIRDSHTAQVAHALEIIPTLISAYQTGSQHELNLENEIARVVQLSSDSQEITVEVSTKLQEEPTPEPEATQESSEFDEVTEVFLEEAIELLAQIDSTLHENIDNSEHGDWIGELQRDLHTLKGSARMAGIEAVGDLGHELESLLELLNERQQSLPKPLMDFLQQCHDQLLSMVEDVQQRRVPSSGEAALAQIAKWISNPQLLSQQTIVTETLQSNISPEEEEVLKQPEPANENLRLRAEQMDGIVNDSAELGIFKSRISQKLNSSRYNLSELQKTIFRIHQQLRTLEIETEAHMQHRSSELDTNSYDNSEFDTLEFDRFSKMHQLSRSLIEGVNDLENLHKLLQNQARDTEVLFEQQHRRHDELHNKLMSTRLVPFSSITPRLRRIIRQTAEALGKNVTLEVINDQLELDRSVLNRVQPTFEHLIRNAIDHGIESTEQRLQSGKPEEGRITITLTQMANQIGVELSDNGAGLDRSKILNKALELGMLNEEDAAQLSDIDIYQYILAPGFSTADQVTQISGRGVGMDVVNTGIKQLGGTLQLRSAPQQGTTFSISLPLTLATQHVLMAKVADCTYGLPLSGFLGLARMPSDEYLKQIASDEPTLHHDGQDYRLLSLEEVMGHSRADTMRRKQAHLQLYHLNDHYLALHADTMLGHHEIVIKPLGTQVSALPSISGGTIMADGSVVLIIDLAAVLRTHLSRHGHVQQLQQIVEKSKNEERKVSVMIVDDSLTVRKMSSRFIERNNMHAFTANDGFDAIEKLQEEELPDVILLDVEMPRMDGFEFATYVRGESQYNHIPIIMITSRTGQKHRERAMNIGVNLYLGKPYNEQELLKSIKQLTNNQAVISHE